MAGVIWLLFIELFSTTELAAGCARQIISISYQGPLQKSGQDAIFGCSERIEARLFCGFKKLWNGRFPAVLKNAFAD
jgi:hypothetical protein